jgi:protein involved in sex pheromone biosynthesis
MKKILSLLTMLILFITGCGSDKLKEADYNFNRSYYKIYRPYKSGSDNNYIINKVGNKYDVEEVELGLMRISLRYFASIKHYYQAGQYLTRDKLISLLSTDKLNKTEAKVIDGITINPKYISYIHEQNYLNKKGELKGISLGIVLNPYQVYTTASGASKYAEINEEEIVQFGKQKADELVTYIRNDIGLKNIDIVIGLYIQNNPSSIVSGTYNYETLVRGDKIISFTGVSEKQFLLTDSNLKTIDLNTYNGFMELTKKIKNENIIPSMMGKALYKNNKIQDINIDVKVSYTSKGEIISLSQIIAEQIAVLFVKEVPIEVTIRNDSNVEVIIVKDKNKTNSEIFFLK